MDVMSCHVI